MRAFGRVALFGGASLLCVNVNTASASLVLDTTVQISGQGLGAVATLVTGHQTTGVTNAVLESGCVGRTGSSDDFGPICDQTNIEGGDEIANGPGGTRTLAELGATQPGDVALLLNISETGQDLSVTLNDIALTFYDANNNVLQTFYLAGSLIGTQVTAGTGTGLGGSGFVFRLDAAQTLLANALVGAVRIGGGFELYQTDDGNETLQAFSLTNPGQNVVPEPTSLLLLGTGIVGVARRFRRRQRA